MIEARISRASMEEYTDPEALAAYQASRLVAQGIPFLHDHGYFKGFSRDGRFQYVGDDVATNESIWRWWEPGEMPEPGAMN
jgi:hypothetical protein